MAEGEKVITQLPQKGAVTDSCNFPTDDSVQTYRVTALQMARYFQDLIFPPGFIAQCARGSIPLGWLLMDGSEYEIESYMRLYAAIGDNFNNCMNMATLTTYANPGAGKFRVPDARGLVTQNVGQAFGYGAINLGQFSAQKTAPNGLSVNDIPTSGHTHNIAHVHMVLEQLVTGAVRGARTKNPGSTDVGEASVGTVVSQRNNPSSVGSNMEYGGLIVPGTPPQKYYSTGVASNQNAGVGPSASSGGPSATFKLSGDSETKPATIGFHLVIKT